MIDSQPSTIHPRRFVLSLGDSYCIPSILCTTPFITMLNEVQDPFIASLRLVNALTRPQSNPTRSQPEQSKVIFGTPSSPGACSPQRVLLEACS